jgi:hypothetical protein
MDNTLTPEELPLDQQVAILIDDLPKPIQDFVRGPERDAVSLELSTKYGLHADQAGVFEQAYLYMLLSVYTPDEFVQELREGGVSEDSIRGLTTDVNERVFKRLQNAERASPPVVPPAQQVPVHQPAPYVPSAPPAPQYQPVAPQPAVRTMAHDMEELKHPQPAPQAFQPQYVQQPMTAPAPAFATTFMSVPTVAPVPVAPPIKSPPPAWQPTPALSFQTASIPNTYIGTPQPFQAPQPIAPMPAPVPAPQPIQPQHLPGSMPPTPVPHFQAPPIAPPTYAPVQPAGIPIVKEYGVDPYRETPE